MQPVGDKDKFILASLGKLQEIAIDKLPTMYPADKKDRKVYMGVISQDSASKGSEALYFCEDISALQKAFNIAQKYSFEVRWYLGPDPTDLQDMAEYA